MVISSAAAANAVMLGSGYFTPLTGYMNLAETKSVAADMKTGDGLLWPTPVVNVIRADRIPDGVTAGSRIALKDPNVDGNPVIAVQEVTSIEALSGTDRDAIISQVVGTDDEGHPGVAAFKSAGDLLIAGPIQVLNFSYFPGDFPESFRTAVELRAEIADRGWNTVVAFQTRNPMHRAHEELCRMAQTAVNADGILIHMLLGKLKAGDIPADVREAVLHAIFRQNSGCSHLIVGRDHAGVGDYYGGFDAQTIFNDIGKEQLQIEIFRGDHTVWCKSCSEVVMMRD